MSRSLALLPTCLLALALGVPAAFAEEAPVARSEAQQPAKQAGDARAATLRTLEGIEQSEAIGLEAWIEGSVADQVRDEWHVERFGAQRTLALVGD